MAIIIGICSFVSILVLVYLVANQLIASGNKYQETFTQTAEANLSEMFIFIEPEKIYLINIGVLMVSFVLTWMYTGAWPIALIVSVMLGITPKFLWSMMRQRRYDRFLTELPDGLLSMSSMMKAGTNLSVALEVIVEESKGPITQEFGLFLRELRIGVDYHQALDNLLERVPVAELELVVAGMKINREIGGSLAEVLERLADTLRRKLEMEGKIKALTAQGKAQGYVMTLLPVFLALALSKIEPEAMARLFSEPIGWATCAIFVTFEVIGYYFIKKIVTIDV